MPLPNSLSAYADIAQDLAALPPEGGRRICASRPDAMRWRHRANKFRALLREGGTTPYDHFVFRIPQSEPNVVVIAPIISSGHLETTGGTTIEAKPAEDELLAEARALAKELGLD